MSKGLIEDNVLAKILIEHSNGKTWAELAKQYHNTIGSDITGNGLRKRVQRFQNRKKDDNFKPLSEKVSSEQPKFYEQHNADGSIDATKLIVDDIKSISGDRDKLLARLGYESKDWDLISWRVSQWDGGVNSTPKYSVQYRIKPRYEFKVEDLLSVTKEAFKHEIMPLYLDNKCDSVQCKLKKITNNRKLMEIAPIELHLGKIADEIQTGEEYTLEIAKQRFNDIFRKIYQKQEVEQCTDCLLVIGGDFFNAENDSCTSVHRIPQQNNHGYLKLFTEGIKMFTQALLTLREKFDNIDVMLCAGNHARAMETFLYIALEQRFLGDDVIHFIEDYKQTQCYCYGNNAIFFNHGDVKLSQIIKSIPAEFSREWGSHQYRELHLGHLHKEVTVDDDGGMITRRIGSPCSTDAWHHENRFICAVKKHEIFIWDKNDGLINVHYIPTK